MPHSSFVIRVGAESVDREWLHDRLSTDTYWATGRSRERVASMIAASDCYSAFDVDDRQVGFARLVTDRTTFGWLSDVYVDRSVRGRGVSRALIDRIVADGESMGLRRILLATDDAAGLYAKHGFVDVADSGYRWMALTWPDKPA